MESKSLDVRIDELDAVLVDHDDLDEFIERNSSEETDIFEEITIYTEDEMTKNEDGYNLIQGTENDYGIATQIRPHPDNPIPKGKNQKDLR